MTSRNYQSSKHQQSGAVLVMALLLLFVLTLIGVSSMNTATMEEKMAGNARDRHLALQASESALIAGEVYVETSVNSISGQFNNSGGSTGYLYSTGDGPVGNTSFNTSWWGATGILGGYATTTNYVTADPQYVVEHRGRIPDVITPEVKECYKVGSCAPVIETFRITARGVGTTGNAVVILQGHYGKDMN